MRFCTDFVLIKKIKMDYQAYKKSKEAFLNKKEKYDAHCRELKKELRKEGDDSILKLFDPLSDCVLRYEEKLDAKVSAGVTQAVFKQLKKGLTEDQLKQEPFRSLSESSKEEQKLKIELQRLYKYFESDRASLEKSCSTLFKYLLMIPLSLLAFMSFVGVFKPQAGAMMLNFIVSTSFISAVTGLYACLLLIVGLAYAYFSRSKLLCTALLGVPTILLMTLVEWKYQAFVEENIIFPLFGSTSIIAAIISLSKTIEENRKIREAKELEERELEEDRLREEHKLEEERLHQERELEKERLHQERELEKERLRNEKAREEARKKREEEDKRIAYLESLRQQAQMAIQSRELDFRVTLKHRVKLIEDVIEFLNKKPIEPDFGESNENSYGYHSALILHAESLLYRVYLYFKSVTLINKLKDAIVSRISETNYYTDQDLLNLVDEFKLRLDFKRYSLEINSDAKRIANTLYRSVANVASLDGMKEMYFFDVVRSHMQVHGLLRVSDFETVLSLSPVKAEIAQNDNDIDDNDIEENEYINYDEVLELFRPSDEYLAKEILRSLQISISDKNIDLLIREFNAVRGLGDDAKSSGGNKKRPRFILNEALREIIKLELGIPDIAHIKFVKQERRNLIKDAPENKNSHVLEWLQVRTQTFFDDAEKTLVVYWINYHGDLNDSILGLFYCGEKGKVEKRLVQPYVSRHLSQRQSSIMPIGFQSIEIPSKIVNEIRANEYKKAFNESDFVEFLPALFDVLSFDIKEFDNKFREKHKEGFLSIKGVLIPNQKGGHEIGVPLSEFEQVSKDIRYSFLSVLMNQIDSNELFFENINTEVETRYVVEKVKIDTSCSWSNDIISNISFSYELDFDEINNDALRPKINQALVWFSLSEYCPKEPSKSPIESSSKEPSGEDNGELAQSHNGELSDSFNSELNKLGPTINIKLKFNASSIPTTIFIESDSSSESHSVPIPEVADQELPNEEFKCQADTENTRSLLDELPTPVDELKIQ